MHINWQENIDSFRLSDELKFYYRLDIDVTNWKIAYRGMLFRSPWQYAKEKEWIPSEEMMILTDGLRWPALYHPRTDKLRVMWRRVEDEVERNNEQRERIALEEWNRPGFGPPSEFWADRYRKKNILGKALKHQCFCVPEDTHSRASAALRLLGDKGETANQAGDS
ncbi:hypothetical protein LTR64_005412 [Lithohypha guttulata]|uniref:uncharacterized protein n=1 Tax=Lithohypha guttulata TaxID=1690604 RepID=UPI002DDE62A1|nr:hypothetical protein LTR51_002795 [Lithohypha guttulata]